MAFTLLVIHELAKWVCLLYAAQFLVGAFNWGGRANNPIYVFLRFLTSPITRVARKLSPKIIGDDKVPLVGFILMFWLVVIVFFLRLVYVRGVPVV
jgi:uncharacterized protein YggT (Ycf19 family)